MRGQVSEFGQIASASRFDTFWPVHCFVGQKTDTVCTTALPIRVALKPQPIFKWNGANRPIQSGSRCTETLAFMCVPMCVLVFTVKCCCFVTLKAMAPALGHYRAHPDVQIFGPQPCPLPILDFSVLFSAIPVKSFFKLPSQMRFPAPRFDTFWPVHCFVGQKTGTVCTTQSHIHF